MVTDTLIKKKTIKISTQWNYLCLIVSLVCCFIVLLGLSFRMSNLVSVGTRVMMLISLFCIFFLDIIIGGVMISQKDYVYFVILSAVFLFCALLSFRSLLSNYINFLSWLMLPAYLVYFYRIDKIKEAKVAIYIFNYASFILFTVLFFSPLSHIYESEYFGLINIDDLTLGFFNPNQTSMFLMVSFIIMLSCFKECRSKIIKIISLFAAVFMVYMIFETHSRTTILISIIYLICFFLRLLKKVGRKTINIVFSIPILFFLISVLFPSYMQEWFLLGEAADTGRSALFFTTLNNINFISFFVGNFGAYHSSNLHNSYFSIFATYGIVGLFVFLYFLRYMYQQYFDNMKKSKNPNYVAFAGTLCVIAHGLAEAAFLTSGVYYALFVSLLFILTLPEKRMQ